MGGPLHYQLDNFPMADHLQYLACKREATVFYIRVQRESVAECDILDMS